MRFWILLLDDQRGKRELRILREVPEEAPEPFRELHQVDNTDSMETALWAMEEWNKRELPSNFSRMIHVLKGPTTFGHPYTIASLIKIVKDEHAAELHALEADISRYNTFVMG